MYFIKFKNLDYLDHNIIHNLCDTLTLNKNILYLYKSELLQFLSDTLIISIININFINNLLRQNNYIINKGYILFFYIDEKNINKYKKWNLDYNKLFIFPNSSIDIGIIPESFIKTINLNSCNNELNSNYKFIVICDFNKKIKINKYNFIFDYYQKKVFIIKIFISFLIPLISFFNNLQIKNVNNLIIYGFLHFLNWELKEDNNINVNNINVKQSKQKMQIKNDKIYQKFIQ